MALGDGNHPMDESCGLKVVGFTTSDSWIVAVDFIHYNVYLNVSTTIIVVGLHVIGSCRWCF